MKRKFFRTLLITLTLFSITNAAVSGPPPPPNTDGVDHQHLSRVAVQDAGETDQLINTPNTGAVQLRDDQWCCDNNGECIKPNRKNTIVFVTMGIVFYVAGILLLIQAHNRTQEMNYLEAVLKACNLGLQECCPTPSPSTP